MGVELVWLIFVDTFALSCLYTACVYAYVLAYMDAYMCVRVCVLVLPDAHVRCIAESRSQTAHDLQSTFNEIDLMLVQQMGNTSESIYFSPVRAVLGV